MDFNYMIMSGKDLNKYPGVERQLNVVDTYSCFNDELKNLLIDEDIKLSQLSLLLHPTKLISHKMTFGLSDETLAEIAANKSCHKISSTSTLLIALNENNACIGYIELYIPDVKKREVLRLSYSPRYEPYEINLKLAELSLKADLSKQAGVEVISSDDFMDHNLSDKYVYEQLNNNFVSVYGNDTMIFTRKEMINPIFKTVFERSICADL